MPHIHIAIGNITIVIGGALAAGQAAGQATLIAGALAAGQATLAAGQLVSSDWQSDWQSDSSQVAVSVADDGRRWLYQQIELREFDEVHMEGMTWQQRWEAALTPPTKRRRVENWEKPSRTGGGRSCISSVDCN